MVRIPLLRRGRKKRSTLADMYEEIFKEILESVGGDPDKVPQFRPLSTLDEDILKAIGPCEEWDDFEQVDTEIYLNLRGLPQSRSIL